VLIARHSLHAAIATTIFLLAMALLIRPLLKRLQLIHEQRGRLGHNMLAAILLLLLASAFTTQAIGLHALFGALVLGIVMPREPKFIRHLTEKFRDFTMVFLLPLFFAYIGLNTDFSTLNWPWLWAFGFIVLAATCTDALLAARTSNVRSRSTSGVMLLLVLLVVLQLQLVSPATFAALVLLALGAIAITTPLLNWIYAAKSPTALPAQTTGFSILIPISLPKAAARWCKLPMR